MKRFYNVVSVAQGEGGWQVTLDGRAIKTVKGLPQIVPTKGLGQALAEEWDAQGEKIDPASLPLRDMVDYALDVVTHTRADIAGKLVAYADTDTLLYRADPDEPLYTRQQEVWEPILTAFEAREGVAFKRVSGIMHTAQDKAALATLRAKLEKLDPFALAGLEAMTSLAASLTTGMSAMEADADALALWNAASLEEEWQAEQWGRDEEAEERRAKRTKDFLRAAEFVRLSAG
jgi:chaperone required for assembly of F1-ATPase